MARFAGCAAEDFRQVGINEYQAGAGVGWHRDKPQFGDVVGVSLVSAVKIRFRKADGERDGREQWIRVSKILEPRSVYIMTGASRAIWEHSVPPVKTLRYSVMFRTLAGPVELLTGPEAEQTARG